MHIQVSVGTVLRYFDFTMDFCLLFYGSSSLYIANLNISYVTFILTAVVASYIEYLPQTVGYIKMDDASPLPHTVQK